MKKSILILLTILMLFTFCACADTTVKGSVLGETSYGNAKLDIMPQKLLEKAAVGDVLLVTIDDFSEEMPFVDELIEEDGKLQLFYDRESHQISLCVYNQHFCERFSIDIGEKVTIKKN